MDCHRYIDKLRKRGFHSLGNGLYSYVLGHPTSNKVIKVSRNVDHGWITYILWAQENEIRRKYAPRLYSMKINRHGFMTAVIDKLDHMGLADDLDDVKRRVLDRNMHGYPTPEYKEQAEEFWPGFTEWRKQFRDQFRGIDWHTGNYGTLRGRLCIIDPVSEQAYPVNTNRYKTNLQREFSFTRQVTRVAA